ncbi:MAG: TlpA disulfide reductase family protein [Bacteroidia bacterium]
MNFSLLMGFWLGLLQMQGTTLPFRFEFVNHDGKPVMIIHNAEEQIVCDEISIAGDSVFVRMPLYNSEFRLKATGEKLNGNWINNARKTPVVIPFTAMHGEYSRFPVTKREAYTQNPSGKWETWFDAGTPDSALAIGIFQEKNGVVTGTFLSESGDHRYLEGVLDGDSLKLSVFDGTHAWLYLARMDGDRMEGYQYSGLSYKGRFTALRNQEIKLRDPSSITKAEGTVSFSLPDPDSNLVSISDNRFRNKVKIIQIMGTWCPNCMDETRFLDSVYAARKDEGLEIIGLSFERPEDFRTAAANVTRMKNRLKVDYPVLIAGVARKGEVEKVLPAIKGFFSYPTTLYIDRKGNIVQVHTGFSGPATGDAWINYQNETRRLLDRLLR